MDKNFIKSILAPLLCSVITAAFITYNTTKENTRDIERNTKEIEAVKRDYVTRREFELKLEALEKTANRIDRNVDKLTQLLLNK